MANDVSTITKPAAKLGYTSAKKPIMAEGRREFFAYRDLALNEASGGQMRGQIRRRRPARRSRRLAYHTCTPVRLSAERLGRARIRGRRVPALREGRHGVHSGRVEAQRAAHLGRFRGA
jgi:hypothetical protein